MAMISCACHTMDLLVKLQKFIGEKNSPCTITYSNTDAKVKCGSEEYIGFIPTIFALCSKSNQNYWGDEEQKYLIYQWLEYASLHSFQMKDDPQHLKSLLQELNYYLDTRSYLVGYSRSLADIVVYYLFYNQFKYLTPTEKDKYKNVSRWFDHVQQDEQIRQENELINFSTLYISNRAIARH